MAIDPNEVLRQAREEAEREEHARRVQNARLAAESRRKRSQREEFVREFLRPATVREYAEWLKGFILGGGALGHFYRYDFPEYGFYVARREIVSVPKFSGALSISIIVPRGIQAPKLTGHMPYGHSVLYFMDGFEIYGDDNPPVYKNISF